MAKTSHQPRSPIPLATSIALSPRTVALARVILLAGAATLAYLPAINGGFLLDDDALLTQNKLIQASHGLAHIWFTTEPQDYWPITSTSFWMEWRWWGTNPVGYHVTNLLLHIAASLLVWAVVRKLSIPGAYLAALLFAVHPVNVESVAWIAQRKNTLSMFFFLLSILCYLCASEKQGARDVGRANVSISWRWYWLSLLFFLLAMLSKGSVAVLPLVLLLIAWWQTGRITRQGLLLTAPFWAIAIVFSSVNIWFQTHASGEIIRSATIQQRFTEAGAAIWFYLSKALLPIDLVFIYPQWIIESGRLLWWLPLLAALIVTALLLLQRNAAQSSWLRALLFAWTFFCAALLPVMGFADVGFMKYSLVADHYQHIAILAVVALVAAGWMNWSQRLHGSPRAASLLIASIVVIVLVGLSWRQSALYADAITLYRDTLDNNPACWLAHNNLATELNVAGKYQDAILHSRTALQLKPNSASAHYCIALAMAKTARSQEAIEHYQQAIEINPSYAEAHDNLGIELAKEGRNAEAVEHFQKALKISPDNAKAHNNLGLLFLHDKQPEKAIPEFEQALTLKSDFPQACASLAQAYADSGRYAESRSTAQRALTLARAQQLTDLANRLEAWLASGEQARAHDVQGSSDSIPTSP